MCADFTDMDEAVDHLADGGELLLRKGHWSKQSGGKQVHMMTTDMNEFDRTGSFFFGSEVGQHVRVRGEHGTQIWNRVVLGEGGGRRVCMCVYMRACMYVCMYACSYEGK
jgi:hypothetical protein